MSHMFGDRINEFVLSADIMSEGTFKELIALVSKYLAQQLDVVYFAVLEEGAVDGGIGLTTLWSSTDVLPSFSVASEGGYSSFSAHSFGTNCPLWVVSESRQELATAEDYQDKWSESESKPGGLPRYRPSIASPVLTSVMHPLHRADKPIGVLEFASSRYIEPTPASLKEVRTLAETISRAYRMYDVRETQRQNTDRALRLLETSLTERSWTRLALPKIFVAYPGGAALKGEVLAEHKRFVGMIREVIDEFGDVLKAVFWEDISESGNITDQVITAITSSEFGLCYFSEPSKGAYVDNDNVLFEAGMMQALANSPGSLLRAWAPIRETNSGEPPFDIRGERMLTVNRDGESGLDDESFKEALRETLRSLLECLKTGER